MEVDGQNGPALDLQAYLAPYTGHAKVDRLLFVAERSPLLELDALKAAADELKSTGDVKRYEAVILRIAGRAGPEYQGDTAWIDSTERDAGRALDRLEADLASAKASTAKEAIRVALTALGDFHHCRGDLNAALKTYMKSRDYCSSPAHVLSMCLSVVKVALQLGAHQNVANYVAKAENTPGALSDPVARAQLKCAVALAHLEGTRYKPAALAFAQAGPDLGTDWSDVATPADIAIAGALTAMASLSRSELKASVIDSPAFREHLAAAPEARDALQDFYASRYSDCLRALEGLRPRLAVDPRLASHADGLLKGVRASALAQAAAPYSALDLRTLALEFGAEKGALEEELAALIASGDISGRIDAGAGVLRAARRDRRATAFRAATAAAKAHVSTIRALLLRASMVQHDLVQRAPPGMGPMPDRPERGEAPGPGRHGRRGGERGIRLVGRDVDRERGGQRDRDREDRGQVGSTAALLSAVLAGMEADEDV